MRIYHTPVMVEEVLEALQTRSGGRYIDSTIGEGGHAQAILQAGDPDCLVMGLDLDPQALEVAKCRLADYGPRVILVQEDFAHVAEAARLHGLWGAEGVLMDLGLSSLQLEGEDRGFSFQRDAPLDMRQDPREPRRASDIVNKASQEELAQLLARYDEGRWARRIAGAVVQARPLQTTGELARVVERALGGRRGRRHPATGVFRALRMAVNRELERLEAGLKGAIQSLGSGGRLAVISYQSLEDRVVKEALRQASAWCVCPRGTPRCTCQHTPEVQVITKKPVRPSAEEIQRNPRSRSARMRVAERV